MATVVSSPEQLVILDNVSWETYERLITEHGERCGTRFTYDEGVLQIMVISSRHEMPNRTLATLVDVLAEEWNIDIQRLGPMTFKRKTCSKDLNPTLASTFNTLMWSWVAQTSSSQLTHRLI